VETDHTEFHKFGVERCLHVNNYKHGGAEKF